MKKLIKLFSTSVLLLGTAVVSYAQDTTTGGGNDMRPHFGVKGGVNFATVTGDDYGNPESRTSFHVGALVEFPLTEMFSIQAEALYSGQGFETDIDGDLLGGEGKVEYQLDYINVPILAKVYVLDGLSLEVGPQFSFKVNEEWDIDANADDGDFEVDDAESFEFGIAAGLSFETSMGLFATGRYNMGVTEVIKDTDAKNSVFQIGIGYKF